MRRGNCQTLQLHGHISLFSLIIPDLIVVVEHHLVQAACRSAHSTAELAQQHRDPKFQTA